MYTHITSKLMDMIGFFIFTLIFYLSVFIVLGRSPGSQVGLLYESSAWI